MQRKKIAELIHTSPENIRYYREKGLIHPAQLENHYYDYSIDDLMFLYQIVEYQSIGYPICSTIQEFNQEDVSLFNSNASKRILELEKEIKRLETLKSILQKRNTHRESIKELNTIKLFESKNPKFYYLSQKQLLENGKLARKMLESSIVAKVLYISRDTFYKNEKITPEICLEFRSENLKIVKEKINCQNVSFHKFIGDSSYLLTDVLCIPSVKEISCVLFSAIQSYLKENNLFIVNTIRGIVLHAEYTTRAKYYVQFIFPVNKKDSCNFF